MMQEIIPGKTFWKGQKLLHPINFGTHPSHKRKYKNALIINFWKIFFKRFLESIFWNININLCSTKYFFENTFRKTFSKMKILCSEKYFSKTYFKKLFSKYKFIFQKILFETYFYLFKGCRKFSPLKSRIHTYVWWWTKNSFYKRKKLNYFYIGKNLAIYKWGRIDKVVR